MPKAWRPAPAITWSVALHGAAGVSVLLVPAAWPWALGTVVLDQLLLSVAGLWPRSPFLGPNLVRLPEQAVANREIALTFDDGPDPEVTPRVLDLLDSAGARASFFCIGQRARRYPALCREIVARGHRIENHGDSHSKAFSFFGLKRLHAEIGTAQACLSDITGQTPRFFRPIAGLRSLLLDPVLSQFDLKLTTWTRRGFDTREGNPARVYARLVRNLAPRDILLLHDGHAARTTVGQAVVLAVLPSLLDDIRNMSLNTATLAEVMP